MYYTTRNPILWVNEVYIRSCRISTLNRYGFFPIPKTRHGPISLNREYRQ